MAMKETIEEKLDRFIHVGWRDKALQNSHGVGKINIAGHAFHVPHRFQKLVIDTALKDSPQLFHFTAEELPPIKGSIGLILRWGSKQTVSGAFGAEKSGNKFPSAANENAEGTIIKLKFGDGQPHQNMQPAVACYSWLRNE